MPRLKVNVKDVERWAPPKGSQAGTKGPIAINTKRLPNGEVDRAKTLFLYQGDFTANLGKQDLNLAMPCTKLKGGSIEYTPLEVTQEMLDQNGGSYEITTNGRTFPVRSVGIRMIDAIITFPSFDITETDINNMRMEGHRVESVIRRRAAANLENASRQALVQRATEENENTPVEEEEESTGVRDAGATEEPTPAGTEVKAEETEEGHLNLKTEKVGP